MCKIASFILGIKWGTGVRGLTRGLETLPQSTVTPNQEEPLVVRDKVKKDSRMWHFFPFHALTLMVGWQEGHPACNNLGVGLLVVTTWLKLCTFYSSSCYHLHILRCNKIWNGDILVLAYPICPGKWPLTSIMLFHHIEHENMQVKLKMSTPSA